jgi:hypothetical protein
MSALPQKRTCAAVFRMSAKGQRQTSAKKVCRLFDHQREGSVEID